MVTLDSQKRWAYKAFLLKDKGMQLWNVYTNIFNKYI